MKCFQINYGNKKQNCLTFLTFKVYYFRKYITPLNSVYISGTSLVFKVTFLKYIYFVLFERFYAMVDIFEMHKSINRGYLGFFW